MDYRQRLGPYAVAGETLSDALGFGRSVEKSSDDVGARGRACGGGEFAGAGNCGNYAKYTGSGGRTHCTRRKNRRAEWNARGRCGDEPRVAAYSAAPS